METHGFHIPKEIRALQYILYIHLLDTVSMLTWKPDRDVSRPPLHFPSAINLIPEEVSKKNKMLISSRLLVLM